MFKLTKNLERLHEYVGEITDGVAKDASLVILLAKMSQIAMINKVYVGNYTGNSIINLYVLNFVPSGAGKDYTISVIDKYLFEPYFVYKRSKEQHYRDSTEVSLRDKGLKEKEITEEMPRSLIDTFQDSTLEGFIAVRKEFEKAGYGGTLVQISEFSDYILSESATREQFLSIIKDVYEDGSNLAKVIKMEKYTESVKNVPCSVLFQSSPEGLLDSKGAIKVKSFLDKGIARRALFHFSTEIEQSEFLDLSYEKHFEKQQLLNDKKEEHQALISRALRVGSTGAVFQFTDSANRMYFEYMKTCVALTQSQDRKESLIAEVRSRPRKAMKLAGLIALIEAPHGRIVEAEHLESAISIVDYYSEYLSKFIFEISADPVMKLINFLLNEKQRVIKLMDLRKQKFVHNSQFRKWFSEALPLAKAELHYLGYKLQETDSGSIGKEYTIVSFKERLESEAEQVSNYLDS